MYMEKPRIEVVRFDAKDVIATSGGGLYTLTVSNFNDNHPDNLNVNFNDQDYTGYDDWDSLRAALVNLQLGFVTDRSAVTNETQYKTIMDWYDHDCWSDGISYLVNLNPDVNGTYTWSADDTKWIHQ